MNHFLALAPQAQIKWPGPIRRVSYEGDMRGTNELGKCWEKLKLSEMKEAGFKNDEQETLVANLVSNELQSRGGTMKQGQLVSKFECWLLIPDTRYYILVEIELEKGGRSTMRCGSTFGMQFFMGLIY